MKRTNAGALEVGIQVAGSVAPVEVSYNCIWGVNSATPVLYQTNVNGDWQRVTNVGELNGNTNLGVDAIQGNISADPLFADEASRDYHLLSASPCIDAGLNLRRIVTDLDGVSRPLDGNVDGHSQTDMGAYEFVHQDANAEASAFTSRIARMDWYVK
jgi:hypothetical protein